MPETNTQRARRVDLENFRVFCRGRGAKALPATVHTVTAYVQHLAAEGKALATIRRRLSSIAIAHTDAGHNRPTRSDAVTRELKNIENSTPPPRIPYPVSSYIVDDVIAACIESSDFRDAAIIALIHEMQLQPHQIVAMDIADLKLNRTRTLIREQPISERCGDLVRQYVRGSQITTGSLFQSVRGNRLSPRDISRIVKRRSAAIFPDGFYYLKPRSLLRPRSKMKLPDTYY